MLHESCSHSPNRDPLRLLPPPPLTQSSKRLAQAKHNHLTQLHIGHKPYLWQLLLAVVHHHTEVCHPTIQERPAQFRPLQLLPFMQPQPRNIPQGACDTDNMWGLTWACIFLPHGRSCVDACCIVLRQAPSHGTNRARFRHAQA